MSAGSVEGLFGIAASGSDAPFAVTPGNNRAYEQRPNQELMAAARATLRGNWGVMIMATLVMFLLIGGASFIPVVGGLSNVLLAPPLTVGLQMLILTLIDRSGRPEVGQLFKGFNCFGTAVIANLLVGIYTFLWTLLLIIPGIMAAYSYSMVFFIIAENPQISAGEAIRRSKEMMHGQRWKLFCLQCRFIGWWLLAVFFTLGIGMLWVIPYLNTATGHFYRNLNRRR